MSSPLQLISKTTPTLDKQLVQSLFEGEVISSPLSTSTPATVISTVSTDFFNSDFLFSTNANALFSGAQTDLIRLFAGSNFNSGQISALEKLGLDDLNNLQLQIDQLGERIRATTDLQTGFNQGYTVWARVNFDDASFIETNPLIVGSITPTFYDPVLKRLSLGTITDADVLHNSTGSPIVDISIGTQLGYPITAYSHLRTPDHAIDSNPFSYWAEVVLSDTTIQLPWPAQGSDYRPGVDAGAFNEIKRGAVAEFVIDFPQPTDWSRLILDPFCEQPINLAAVIVIKRKQLVNRQVPGETFIGNHGRGYGIYGITQYGTSAQTAQDVYISKAKDLVFPIQEDCLRVVLVIHQPHYNREVFLLPQTQAAGNSLWQQMLGDSPILGIPSTFAIDEGVPQLNMAFSQPTDVIGQLASAINSNLTSSFIKPTNPVDTYAKYEYVYGAYTIDLKSTRYKGQSTFISTVLDSVSNITQGTIVADDKLPFITADLAATGFFGNATPNKFQVPSSTVQYYLSFGQDSATWYPFAPINRAIMHEPLILTGSHIRRFNLSLVAEPNTPVFITNFDGGGNVTLLGSVLAPSVPDSGGSQIILPVFLASPGFYVVSYFPQDTSTWVNLATLAQAADSAKNHQLSFTGVDIPVSSGIHMGMEPFIDQDRISPNFEPNGEPGREYVPIQVTVTNLPITFSDSTVSTFIQDQGHTLDIYVSVQISLERLFSADANPNAAVNFQASTGNWDTRPNHIPSLFVSSSAGNVPIPNMDSNGRTVWVYDPIEGTVTFVNGNAGVSGEILLSYWHYTSQFASPIIVNRTDFSGRGDFAMTPFDPVVYPIIEYVLIEDKLLFNLPIPQTATVTVQFYRLFDGVRVKAVLTRVDPVNESSSPYINGYTFLARDANGTSLETQGSPEVTWADLEVYSLGSNTQTNPFLSFVQGVTGLSNQNLPLLVQIDWFRIVNSGSVTDQLRANYDSTNGSLAVVDLNSDTYLESDGTISIQLNNWMVLSADGSQYIEVQPGSDIVVGVLNYQGGPNNSVTIYSGQSSDFLQSSNWLLQAAQVTAQTSAASVVIQ